MDNSMMDEVSRNIFEAFSIGDGSTEPGFECGDAPLPSNFSDISMIGKVVWTEYQSPTGEHYFRHNVTHEIRRERPESTLVETNLQPGFITPVVLGGVESMQSNLSVSDIIPGQGTVDSPVTFDTPTLHGIKRLDGGLYTHNEISSSNRDDDSQTLSTSVKRVRWCPSTPASSTINNDAIEKRREVESATAWNEFAHVSFVEIWESTDGRRTTTTGIVSHDDLEGWLTSEGISQLGSRKVRLVCVQSDSIWDTMHTRKETFQTVITKLGILADLKMYSRRPQMSSFAFKIPLVGCDFVFHSQSAITVNQSTLLSYKYFSANNSIDGMVIDTRPQITQYTDRLRKLVLFCGNSALPLLALAQHSLFTSKFDANDQEDTYYRQKEFFHTLQGEDETDSHRAKLQFSISIGEVVRTLGATVALQSKCLQDLLDTIKHNFSDNITPEVQAFLTMISSANKGISHFSQRLDRRMKISHAQRMEEVQSQIAHETQKTFQAQLATLNIMKQLDEGRNNLNEIMNSNLSEMRDLSHHMKDLGEAQSKSGLLITALTVVTVPFLTGQTIAGILTLFNITKPQVIFWPSWVGVTIVIWLGIILWRFYGGKWIGERSNLRDEKKMGSAEDPPSSPSSKDSAGSSAVEKADAGS